MIRDDRDRDHDDFDADGRDGDESDDDDTDECPRCSEPVYDDAERCPHCGLYLTREKTGPKKPWWVTLGVIGCLSMVAWWVIHSF